MKTEITIEAVKIKKEIGFNVRCKNCAAYSWEDCFGVVEMLTTNGLPNCKDGYIYKIKE